MTGRTAYAIEISWSRPCTRRAAPTSPRRSRTERLHREAIVEVGEELGEVAEVIAAGTAVLARGAGMPYGLGMNARVRQLLDELLQLSAEDRALVAAELDASLDEAAKRAKRARFEAAVKRVVKDHDAILAELAK
jgi:hypothetical protein